MKKIYNGEVFAEVAERTGMSIKDVKRVFGVYEDVLQEKITDAKTGDIVELAGGVGSLTISLIKSRHVKTFKSNSEEEVWVDTACKRGAKLNAYKKVKENLQKHTPEYGVEDAETLAYISRHRHSSKYTVSKVQLAEPIENKTVESDVATHKKGIKSLFERLKSNITPSDIKSDNRVEPVGGTC
jgi:nucleoid DNA-binding protein